MSAAYIVLRDATLQRIPESNHWTVDDAKRHAEQSGERVAFFNELPALYYPSYDSFDTRARMKLERMHAEAVARLDAIYREALDRFAAGL